jgi:hypothetical protein
VGGVGSGPQPQNLGPPRSPPPHRNASELTKAERLSERLRRPGRRGSISRVLSRARVAPSAVAIIPLRTAVARRLKRPTRRLGRATLEPGDAVSSLRRDACLCGLAPDGVCRAARVAVGAVGSYPAVSPLPPRRLGARRRFVFCGTLLGVSATGRYPASCSMELGLSSRCEQDARDRATA